MALKNQSLFLYGYQITKSNSSIDFRAVSLGPILQATLKLGYYSLATLLDQIVSAMQAVDPNNLYTVTANRNIMGGLENRTSIATSGAYLDILGLTGPRVASSALPLIGWNSMDYTGATTYTGQSTSGTVLVPQFVGYNFIPPTINIKNFGAVNVSISGDEEAVTFALQKFWQAQFKWETTASLVAWTALFLWIIQHRSIDFTPDITDPTTFYTGVIVSTATDGKGLAWKPTEMLSIQQPDTWDIGLCVFRVRNP